MGLTRKMETNIGTASGGMMRSMIYESVGGVSDKRGEMRLSIPNKCYHVRDVLFYVLYVISDNTSIIAARDRSEAFLAGCIPDLEFSTFTARGYHFTPKFDAYSVTTL